ncbi:hypothetical protein [Microbacterium sp. 4R-513]|uniref:hypothetical protein n=1 Tax=Microbacterium sp. 4R-513 TaxID=2567934 RepID=UPI001F49F8BE|nr:hypothetical protein [Microbacterium sp. 4R-513]
MDIDFDDDRARVQRDAVWRWLSTEAYWGGWRTRDDLEAQLDSAWRVVGVYRRDTGEQVGFARAVSDGVGFAYLADVYVVGEHSGRGARAAHALAHDRRGSGRGLPLGALHPRRAQPLRAVRLRGSR